ncbi:MAG: hypothetical protein GY708_06325, partial [Actinomycetia bacterium]|nr:hypothetical protein [Actinomycetes bacterium]
MMKRLSLACGVTAAMCSTAFAQNLPDVSVSRHCDGSNYYGQSGGVSAFSFSTTSCNVGNVVIDWADPWNMPVIGQNMFM